MRGIRIFRVSIKRGRERENECATITLNHSPVCSFYLAVAFVSEHGGLSGFDYDSIINDPQIVALSAIPREKLLFFLNYPYLLLVLAY